MEYHVYQKTTVGWSALGQLRHKDDAIALLDKWGDGYVAYRGDIIYKKGHW